MNNAQLVIDEVKKAVKGKDDCIIKAFAAFLAGGHILLEDVPGVGKTTLAVAFSRAMALVNHRVQFTPDCRLNPCCRYCQGKVSGKSGLKAPRQAMSMLPSSHCTPLRLS